MRLIVRSMACWCALPLLLPSCGKDGEANESGSTESSGSTAPQTSTEESSTTTTTGVDGSESGEQTVTTVPAPECGNGNVEAPEECDDANMRPGDGCEPDCTESVDTSQWQVVVGGEANVQEAANAVAVDSMGNAVVAGFIVDALGNGDIWVRKFDADGNELWTFQYDPSMGSEDRAYGVDVDATDAVLVTGSATVSGSATDVWIGKLAADGTALVWERSVDGGTPGGADIGQDVVVDSAGNVIACALLRVANNDNDMWIGAYDSGGTALWSETVVGPEGLDDRCNGIDVDADDNVIAAGFISHSGFNRDVWIRKYDPSGAEVWTVSYDSINSGSDAAYDVAVAPDGGIGIAGTTPINAANDNIWLAKYDAEGEMVWMKDYGGPAILNDVALGVAADTQSAFVVVGYKGIGENDNDIWMRKWDATGSIVWTQVVAGAGMDEDQALGVVADGSDNIYAVGEIREMANNNGDIWVGKFGP